MYISINNLENNYMLLAIDSGNTNVVFAVFSDVGELLGEWRAGTEQNKTDDEFGIWLTQLLEQDGIDSCLLYTSPSPRDRG